MKRIKFSVIVITKNEEAVIKDCLESVKWAEEIIILDTGSIDQTLKIAREYTDKIFVYSEKPGIDYSAWRNYSASKAKGEWLFYLDSDERVPPLLKREIEMVISDQWPVEHGQGEKEFVAFAMPRRNIRLTKELHFGGWWPDYVLRLIKKKNLEKWEGQLHEQPIIKGEVGKLSEPLVHYSHRGSFEHKVTNTIVWSKLEAELLMRANHPPMNTKRFFGAMGREFYKRMIKYQAWRDGTEGIIEAFYQVFSVFITYAQLWELQQKNESRNF